MIEKIYLDCPHPFDTYLDRLTNNIIIFYDNQLKILEFNQGFKKAVNIPEKEIYNKSLDNIFTIDSMELISFSADQNYNKTNLELDQSITIKKVEREYICHTFKLENFYCLIGEDTGSEDEEVLNKISKLNNELSSITRELSKKNMKLEKANQRIKELSRRDPLTGLYNRRAFMEYFEKQLAQFRRHSHLLSLIITDIDDFKEINDSYGHSAGDDVLEELGQLLAQETRQEDMAARVGGEEFAILLVKTDKENASKYAERVRQKLKNLKFKSIPESITLSFGIAEARTEDDLDGIYKRSDKALYKAKEAGKDRIEIID